MGVGIGGGVIEVRELVAREHRAWGQIEELIGGLTPEQMERPGYFEEGWSCKDLLAHLAGWLAEAGQVLQQVKSGTYTGRDMDVDKMNADFLEANRSQPLSIVQAEVHAARTRLLHEAHELESVSGEAAAWLAKAGPDHYAEHLPRLVEWVQELRSSG
jgi:hypothetical protein